MRSSRAIRSITLRVTFWLSLYTCCVKKAFVWACWKVYTAASRMSAPPRPGRTSMLEKPGAGGGRSAWDGAAADIRGERGGVGPRVPPRDGHGHRAQAEGRLIVAGDGPPP